MGTATKVPKATPHMTNRILEEDLAGIFCIRVAIDHSPGFDSAAYSSDVESFKCVSRDLGFLI